MGLRRGGLLCTWTNPHFPLVLNSEPQWLSTYPGATKLAYRLWHPIMCLFKTFSLPGTACLQCLSSYALLHSERIQLKSVHSGTEKVQFHSRRKYVAMTLREDTSSLHKIPLHPLSLPFCSYPWTRSPASRLHYFIPRHSQLLSYPGVNGRCSSQWRP